MCRKLRVISNMNKFKTRKATNEYGVPVETLNSAYRNVYSTANSWLILVKGDSSGVKWSGTCHHLSSYNIQAVVDLVS